MDFNLTEISVINVVFVKEDSRLTIATTPTKGISIREIVLFTKEGLGIRSTARILKISATTF